MMRKAVSTLFLLVALSLSLDNFTFAETDDIHDETEKEPEVLLFLFFGLVVGVIVYQIISIYEEIIPYTVIVFIIGVIIGAIQSSSSVGTFGSSIESWSRINAELILFIFLPPLLFGEVMGLNWHHVKGGILQSIILAGPGVLMGAALMGCLVKGILPYNWSWNLSMTFGAILAATDPVAVVALLKSVGASPTLTILIVGESLLNDGTAIVLFELFHAMLNGEEFTAGDIIVFALRAVVGSVVVGFAFGIVTLRWLRSAKRPLREEDTLIQTVVTICSAYLCFFTAQYSFKMSGVLACCSAGVLIAWLGPPIILNHESMHKVWGLMEWGFNTLIFLLAGLIIGHRRFEADGMDWVYLFVLFFMLILVRCVVLAILYPFLSRAGLKVSINEAIFMSWAGLRGALAMVLGLIVERGTSGNDEKQKELGRLFFFVSAIAALTLLVNATTAKMLLQYLGLIGKDAAQKQLIFDVVKRQLRNHIVHAMKEMSADFSPQHLQEGKQALSLFADADDYYDYDAEADESQEGAAGGGRMKERKMSSTDVHTPFEAYRAKSGQNPQSSIATAPSFSGGASGISASPMRASASASVADPLPEETEAEGEEEEKKDGNGVVSKHQPRRSLTIVENHNPMFAQKDSSVAGSGAEGDIEQQQQQHPSTLSQRFSEGPSETPDASRASSALFALTRPSSARAELQHKQQKELEAAATRISRLLQGLDRSNFDGTDDTLPEILQYVRTVFLEIVRAQYWELIESERLPRLSHSAQFLLYTIDVALDEVITGEKSGARDWAYIEAELDSDPWVARVMQWGEKRLPQLLARKCASMHGAYDALRQKRAVFILEAFLKAHDVAQSKLHEFLSGGHDGRGMVAGGGTGHKASQRITGRDAISRATSPEEALVLNESEHAVQCALERLAHYPPQLLLKIRGKMAARVLLGKQSALVQEIRKEGMLTGAQADELLEEIDADRRRVEKQRRKLHTGLSREQAVQRRATLGVAPDSEKARQAKRMAANAAAQAAVSRRASSTSDKPAFTATAATSGGCGTDTGASDDADNARL